MTAAPKTKPLVFLELCKDRRNLQGLHCVHEILPANAGSLGAGGLTWSRISRLVGTGSATPGSEGTPLCSNIALPPTLLCLLAAFLSTVALQSSAAVPHTQWSDPDVNPECRS